MSEQSAFHLISALIQKERISCILIGGFAVNYYKVTRQTADVDFLITRKDFDRIFIYLEKAGYKMGLGQENFAQLKSSRIALMDIDFVFVDQETLAQILQESQKVKIAKQEFFVPSLDHLTALKLHSIKYNPKIRLSRDLPDIINLIRINKVNVQGEKFKTLCLKYGTEEIYAKILEAVQ